MDKQTRRHIWLGFFVLVGILLFIAGIFFVGSKNEIFDRTFPISVNFSNAAGLKPGSNVRYNGVKVGIVKSVTLLSDTLVHVELGIEVSHRGNIRKSAFAVIASDGLMGDKLVNISPAAGDSTMVTDHDVLAAHNPINTDQALLTLSQSNENLKVITDNLKKLTGDIVSNNGPIQMLYKNPEMARQLKQSFSNLDAVSGKVLAVSGTLQQVSQQIQHGSGALGELVYDTTLARNISYSLNKLKETSDQLVSASTDLTNTVAKANNGKGAVNMLLSDTSFSGNVQQSMINIKKASEGLNENMEALKHSFLTRGYFRRQERKNRKAADTAR